MDGLFTEGSSGLFAFEINDGKIFVGTCRDLIAWWEDSSSIMEEGSLLRAIVFEIVGSDAVSKYDVWRAYAAKHSDHYSNDDNEERTELSELITGKLEFFQKLDQFRQEIEQEKKNDEDTTERDYKLIISKRKEEILDFLESTGNYSLVIWSWVWEHADRVFLTTEESRELLMSYIAFMNDGYSDVFDRNISYIIRRTLSFENWNSDERELLREYFTSVIPARKRSRIDPITFSSYLDKLYVNDAASLVVDLIRMLGNITSYIRFADVSIDTALDFKVVAAILLNIKEKHTATTITDEEIQTLVRFYAQVLMPVRELAQDCEIHFDEILQPFGVDCSMILGSSRGNPASLDEIMEGVRHR